MNIVSIKDSVEALPQAYHKEVARILIENKVPTDENKNGMFVNLSNVPQEVLDKLVAFIQYVELQQKTLSTGESKRDEIKNQYFG